MPFKKGDPRPPGSGRAPGTKNKSTVKTYDIIVNLLDEYQTSGKMSQDFNDLEPDKRIAIAERLMGYVLPKKQAVQSDVRLETQRRTIEDTLLELAEENQHS